MKRLSNYGRIKLNENLGIRITIDDKFFDFSRYSCFFVGKETKRKAPTIKTIKALKSFNRIIQEEIENDDELTVNFLFVGQSHDVIWNNIRMLSNTLKHCAIKFNTEEYYYYSILKDYDDKFLDWNRCAVTLKFDTLQFSMTEKIKLDKLENNITVRGARDTPINYIVTAKENVKNVNINDIVIKELNANEIMVIDSFNSKVTINGNNAIDKVSIFNFPLAVGRYNVTISDEKIEVEMNYKARW